jgi:hypothetical protein
MKITMGSHLTNAANLSNDWGPPLPQYQPERGSGFGDDGGRGVFG